ncbi:MAG: methyltransferase domain-containing protein [Oscillatoria sp. SIO1A7]|nr:methyltransferase domain-containing protein [Oscillatoria sp. SIO1A7]
MEKIKLNLGCGDQIVNGWLNVDYSVGARLAKIPLFPLINKKLRLLNLDWNEKILLHDLTKKFPWSDESVDEIYSSHTLEHLDKNQGDAFLSECYRVLKKEGIIRIVVPDLRAFVDSYVKGELLAENFVKNLGVLYEEQGDSSLKRRLAPLIRFPHKCMYDTERLLEIMSLIGFDCQSTEPFTSEISDIKNIELPERTVEAVIVEGKKR